MAEETHWTNEELVAEIRKRGISATIISELENPSLTAEQETELKENIKEGIESLRSWLQSFKITLDADMDDGLPKKIKLKVIKPKVSQTEMTADEWSKVYAALPASFTSAMATTTSEDQGFVNRKVSPKIKETLDAGLISKSGKSRNTSYTKVAKSTKGKK